VARKGCLYGGRGKGFKASLGGGHQHRWNWVLTSRTRVRSSETEGSKTSGEELSHPFLAAPVFKLGRMLVLLTVTYAYCYMYHICQMGSTHCTSRLPS
jgi:hypothetical protein